MHVVVAAVLGAWLLASCIAQFLPRDAWLKRRFDPHQLVPDWRMFAPTPAFFDYHVVARTVSDEGSIGPWCEITPVRRRCWWHPLFHPFRRVDKAFFDACSTLVGWIVLSPEAKVSGTSPYLRISALASRANSAADAYQFMIMRSTPREPDAAGFIPVLRSPAYRRREVSTCPDSQSPTLSA